MRVFVPFDATDPKTRLAPVLSRSERAAFARRMLTDVVSTIRRAGVDPEVIATAPVDCEASVTVDDRSLDDVVNDRLEMASRPIAVVMADLALATPEALATLFEADGEVVLAPGRGGGTNAFVARHLDFRVDYHGASITDHRAIADEIGASLTEVDSYRLGTDVDEPADLPEVLLHGTGEAAAWLRDRGFELTIDDGRVDVTQNE